METGLVVKCSLNTYGLSADRSWWGWCYMDICKLNAFDMEKIEVEFISLYLFIRLVSNDGLRWVPWRWTKVRANHHRRRSIVYRWTLADKCSRHMPKTHEFQSLVSCGVTLSCWWLHTFLCKYVLILILSMPFPIYFLVSPACFYSYNCVILLIYSYFMCMCII